MKPLRFPRILILALIATLTFGAGNANALSKTFSDVNDTHQNQSAISYLTEKGILQGYSDGTFKPEVAVNRAEQLKILIEGKGITPDANTYKNCFPDVKDEWFAKYVCYAKQNGWVQGYPDGYFRPEQTVNKVEAIKMLMETQGLADELPENVENELQPETVLYNDVDSNAWFAPYVWLAKKMALLEETQYEFSPAEGMRRAGISENLYRYLITKEKNLDAFPGIEYLTNFSTTNWQTYTNTTFSYTFQYPKDWQLGDSPYSSVPSPTATNIAFDGTGYTGIRFAVGVTSPTNCSSLRTCTENNRASFGTEEQSSGLNDASVAGKPALTETITRPTTGNWKYYVWYIYREGWLYTLHTIAKATDDATTKPTFDQILSTFQFRHVTIMVPEDEAVYKEKMTKYVQEGGEDPLVTTKFIEKEISVSSPDDPILASAQAAAEEIPPSGGPAKASVSYFEIENDTAYVLLDIDIDSWAGASVSRAIIHPLVEKTLLQFSEITSVMFDYAPEKS